jgi:hypothetical protein
VWGAVELTDIHDVALIFENGCFVIIHIEIVGGGEDGHDGGEACAFRFTIHAVPTLKLAAAICSGETKVDLPGILSFMCTDDRKQVIAFEELTCGLIAGRQWSAAGQARKIDSSREEIRAPADMIMHKTVRYLFLTEIFDRI